MNLMIDTLGYAEALEQSGFTSEQAKGAAKALNNTFGEELATKADLAQLSTELRAEITKVRAEITELRAEMKGELKLIHWMLGIVVIAVVIPLIRDFML